MFDGKFLQAFLENYHLGLHMLQLRLLYMFSQDFVLVL